MGEMLMLAIGALVAAAIGSGIGRVATGAGLPGTPTALSRDDAFRAFVVAIARAALGPFGSDQWHQVSQGRKGEKYSNCGDLPHAVLWWAGCREANVNRQGDGRQWVAGNIAKLSALFSARNGWTWFPTPTDFRPGDTYLIGEHTAGEPEHVGVVLSVDGSTIVSADYGQAGQGGEIRTRRYTLTNGKWRADDGRRLVARGNLIRLPLVTEPDPPRVLRTPAVDAAAAALLAANRSPNA